MSRPKLEAFGSPLCYRPSSLTKCFSVSVFCRDQGIWAQTGEWCLAFSPRELRVGRGVNLCSLDRTSASHLHHPLLHTLRLINLNNLFLFIIYFLAALGLRSWAWPFSSCSEQGLLSSWDARPLTAAASLVPRAQALGCQASVDAAPGL